MREDLGRQEQFSFLRNPFILGALAVVAVLLMVAIVLVLVGGGGDEEEEGETAAASRTETSEGTRTPGADGSTLMAEVIATINVRSGPDEAYPVLGTIRSGTRVEVSGRGEDDEWLQVVYPPRSTLHGWVDAAYLKLEGDVSVLAVATAEVAALPEMPTQAPVTPVVVTLTPTPEVTATATIPATPEPVLPDLVLTAAYLLEDSLIATVRNQGMGSVEGQAIEVSVLDSQGQTVLGAGSVALETLGAGQSIDVNTGFTCTIQERPVLVVVDLSGLIDETDNTNNQLVTTLAPCWRPPPPTLTPSGPSTEMSTEETPAP